MSDPSPIDELLQEHGAALAAFDGLVQQLADVEAGAATWEDVGSCTEASLHALHQLLLLHFGKEEECLFPEIVGLANEALPEAGIVAGFFAEQSDDEIVAHTTLRIRLREMEILLPDIREMNGAGEHAPRELHDALVFSRQMLRRHTEKEEKVIFPLIERLLTAEQMTEVRHRIAELIPSA